MFFFYRFLNFFRYCYRKDSIIKSSFQIFLFYAFTNIEASLATSTVSFFTDIITFFIFFIFI